MQIQILEGLVLGKDTIVSTYTYCSIFIGGSLAFKTKSLSMAIQRKPLSCGTKLKSFFPNLMFSPWSIRFEHLIISFSKPCSKLRKERKQTKMSTVYVINSRYVKIHVYHCICLENIFKIKKCTMLVKMKPTYKHITRR